MSHSEFLHTFAELVAEPAARVQMDTPLASLAGWDSMGHLSALSLLDELGVRLPKGALQQCQTVGDIVKLTGTKLTP